VCWPVRGEKGGFRVAKREGMKTLRKVAEPARACASGNPQREQRRGARCSRAYNAGARSIDPSSPAFALCAGEPAVL